MNPSCFRPTGATMGFCTADCTINATTGADNGDCGDLASCIQFSDGTACIKNCQAPTDCGAGFACWFNIGCFPTTDLDCDPTVANCTTTAEGVPGGCTRDAVKDPNNPKTGTCHPLCEAGKGTCGPDNQGNPRTCLFFDETTDTMQMATGDAFKGLICAFEETAMACTPTSTGCQQPDGTFCTIKGVTPDNMTPSTTGYIDLCHDGSECDVFKVAGKNDMPDNKCHPLCYQNTTPPSTTPAGTPDMGVVAMSCATGCKDAFGMFGTSVPIGLCK
jgi:hypothetical protein